MTSPRWIDPPPLPPWIRELINSLNDITKETPVTTDPSTLRREAAALLAEADRLESRPKDTHAEGTVLTFTKPGRYGNRNPNSWEPSFKGPLKYAAIKAGDRPACWFLTGMQRYAKTWAELLDFIGEANLETIKVASFGPDVEWLVEALDKWFGTAGRLDTATLRAIEGWDATSWKVVTGARVPTAAEVEAAVEILRAR